MGRSELRSHGPRPRDSDKAGQMYTTTAVTLVQPGLLQPLPPVSSQNPLSAHSFLQGLGWIWDACPALWHLEELPREHK